LISGKQVLVLASKRPSNAGSRDEFSIFEMLLPIETFWEAEKLLKDLDFMRASFGDPVSILQMQKKILEQLVNYVVLEKDRLQLKAAINGAVQK